jgi:uncharacterized protein
MSQTLFARCLLIPVLFISAISVSFSQTADVPPRPSPPRLVNVLSDRVSQVFSPGEAAALEARLVEFGNQTSNQICVVVTDTLNGLEPNDYATRIIRTWAVGQAKLNNGIVMVVKPKTATERGEVYITTGYGLEGAIPDITCRQIEQREMIPKFKEGNYAEGINAGVTVLMALAKGEFDKKEYAKRGNETGGFRRLIPALVIILVLFFFFMSRGGGGSAGAAAGGFWIGSGGFGGGGFGGGGGGGGGGFGGFGGGSGGGGGAGGSW